MKSTSSINSLVKAEDIAGLRIIVGSGTNQEAILLAWNEENLKKGLKPFTPIYTKDDAAQTLALQSGRADAYFGPNVIGAWKAALNGKTKLVGSVDGGWPKAAHIAVTLKKGSGLVEPVQTALNGAIKNGDYDKVLNRWGKAWSVSPVPKLTRRVWAIKEALCGNNFVTFRRKIPIFSPLSRGFSVSTPLVTATTFQRMRKSS